MGRLTRTHRLLRYGPEPPRSQVDVLAVEEPLEIRLNGEPFQVTMRTPGNDIDLVHGLLFSESVIADRTDVATMSYCEGCNPGGVWGGRPPRSQHSPDGLNTYNVLDVRLAAHLPPPAPELHRHVLTSSACGICGTTSIDQVVRSSRHQLPTDVLIASDVVLAAPELLRSQQRAFAKTGGLHAAGLLSTDGAMVCVREDVGRHNAVDKVIGWAIREARLPLSEAILTVSGRASFELTQKAVLAGIPMLAAVSAPSSLAVELAETAGLTLAGFVRGESMNVYTHPERLKLSG
jgi:FdhD protein